MDIRHPLKEFDTAMLQWAEESEMPVHILLTKADKLKFGAAKKTLLDVRKRLKEHPAPLTVQLFSATEPRGCEAAWDKIGEWLGIEPEQPDAG